MGVRVIATSAVRCVGNTLLLHGQTYSPPFTITAIGDLTRMKQSLSQSPGVQQYLAAKRQFNLGYLQRDTGTITIPAYDGSLGLSYAKVPSR